MRRLIIKPVMSLALFFGLFLFSASAQNGRINGRVVDMADSLARAGLKGASVQLLTLPDSTLVKSAVTGVDGSFGFSSLVSGIYALRISYSGYVAAEKNIILSADQSTADLGKISLQRFANLMESIIIRSSTMAVMGDTTEFNASQFKTLPNASTEDLLKKVPGIDVDRDGSIKSQGAPVTRKVGEG